MSESKKEMEKTAMEKNLLDTALSKLKSADTLDAKLDAFRGLFKLEKKNGQSK